ncbi:hypothetical protein ISS37_09140 [candidate division KSB1 bacterium]|nr:hypothetical protein [candidate division KSB1 bacterium]
MQRKFLTSSQINQLPNESGVYFLYQGSILVYIGKAINLRTRVPDHDNNKKFDGIEFEVTHWSRARKLEKQLLQDYFNNHNQYPHYNKQG